MTLQLDDTYQIPAELRGHVVAMLRAGKPVRSAAERYALSHAIVRQIGADDGLVYDYPAGRRMVTPRELEEARETRQARDGAVIDAMRAARDIAADHESGASSWEDLAVCAQVDPELFFPDDTLPTAKATAPAKRICAVCEVQPQCLTFALTHRIMDGVWGGRDENERRLLLLGQAV